MRFTILWEIIPLFPCGKFPFFICPYGPPHKKNFPYGKSPLPLFPYGEFPLVYMGNPHFFHHPPLWGISPLFTNSSPWEIPKKKSGKNFFFGIYGQLFPQKWGCPLGRGGMGGYLPPPLWDIWGGVIIKITYHDYLFGYLFGCYLFSMLLISFFLAVSDAILLFIFATFLLWRYLL